LDGPVFFDRSVVEPLVSSKMLGLGLSEKVGRQAKDCRYNNPIFVVPPWEEIFVQDAKRRHSFRDAINEYEALHTAFLEFNYEVRVLPKMAIDARVDYIVEGLGL
jgi:predicted ATPase